MTSILAPVLPHLAEEIHAHYAEDTELSFFTKKWVPLVRRDAGVEVRADGSGRNRTRSGMTRRQKRI